MPEVKELKGVDVAGSATAKDTRKDFFIQWHLTDRCNLSCRHCYQIGPSRPEMHLSTAREIIDEVSDMLEDWSERYDIHFTPSFNITGGEPFLREDLFEILTAVKQRGFEVYLLTNGTVIDAEKAAKLRPVVDGVQVSVEGPEAVHDSVRGKGAFQKAVRGVERLLAEDINVSLNVTIFRLNMTHLSGLFNLGSRLGVRRIGFSRLVPSGQGKKLADLMLEPDEVRDVYAFLLGLKDQKTETGTGDPIASLLQDNNTDDDAGDVPVSGCAAGVSGLTVLPDGTLTPCRRLPIPIGNVNHDSIRQIWSESPVLNLLRDRSSYTGECGSCSRWAVCRGCRAIAYARSKGPHGFLGGDPQCFSKSRLAAKQ